SVTTVCSVFFFSSRRRHTRSKRDWSSDVCSSDLRDQREQPTLVLLGAVGARLVGGRQRGPLLACVLALGVVPALRGGLASACAHGREGLASGAVGARAGVGGAGPASGDVAADAAGHREAIALRGHVGLAVVGADRL